MTEYLLSDVAAVESGAGFPVVYQGVQDAAFPFLKVSDMNLSGNERAIKRWNHSISEQVRGKLRAKAFPGGSLIFPKVGAAIATNKKRQLTRPSCVDNNVMAILPKPELLDPDFLYYLFLTKNLSDFASDSNPPSIRKSDVEKWKVRVPPLPEQRRIVDLLSRAEGIVRLRREAEKKAAELIPALFLDMFGDPGRNPKGWPVALLPDVLSRPFKNGLYLPKDKYAPEDSGTGVEMVHMSDAFYGEVKRGHLRRVLADQKQVLDYGLTSTDLLVARRSLTFDGAAKICGVPLSDEPLLFESSFIRLTPKLDVVRTVFLLNYLNSESTRKAYVLSRISGITISGINQAAMNQIPVLLPPVPLQNDFVSKANEVQSIQSQQSTATAKAKATFDALLAQAFSNNGANV